MHRIHEVRDTLDAKGDDRKFQGIAVLARAKKSLAPIAQALRTG